MVHPVMPEWAQVEFEEVRPAPGASEANVQAWSKARDRFAKGWHQVKDDAWTTDSARTGWRRRQILGAAIECARAQISGQDPAQSVEAAQRLLALDEQIGRLGGELVDLLRERGELVERFGLDAWTDQGFDPLDLWGALQESFERGGAQDLAGDVRAALERAMRMANGTTRPLPGWAELLEVLALRALHSHLVTLPGAVPLRELQRSRTNSTIESKLCHLLLSMLEERAVMGPDLAARQIANLASLALDNPEIDAQRIGALMRRRMLGERA